MLIINRRINFDFNIHHTFEAGIVLTGEEVKSIRQNNISVNDCYVSIKDNEVWLLNWNIPKYKQSFFKTNYDPKRPRKLLLKKPEISRLIGLVNREGFSMIISKCYTTRKGFIKLEIALATAKKKYDKRQYIKEKDARREARTKFND